MEAPTRSSDLRRGSEFRGRQVDDWLYFDPGVGRDREPKGGSGAPPGFRSRSIWLLRLRAVGHAIRSRVPRDRSGWLRLFLIVATAALVLVAAVLFLAWKTIELPKDVPLTATTFLTDAKGARLATLNTGENRVPVRLADVPEVVQRAVTDTEDRSFFRHKGIDPKGILRALVNDAKGGSGLQGGSTITQQYVKTQYVGQERTASRKFREAILAMKLENKMSKDEIFERYLNAIYFGRGAYGVEAASRTYFHKSVSELKLPEAAYLAGLIRAPEAADPYKDMETAEGRRNLTLDNMVRFGSINPEDADAVKAIDLKKYVFARTKAEPTIVSADKGTQYFVEYVRRTLINRYGEETVDTGGLTVKTTLDLGLQAKAYDSVYGFLKPNEPAGALVSLNANGEIKAMVGGRDYAKSQVNLAVGREGGGSGRQAGSTFKPFALAAALDKSIPLSKTYPGPAKKTFDNGKWPVSNFDNESFSRINLVDATVHSVNTVYAQLTLDVGPKAVADLAKAAGIESALQPNPSIVLGTDDVSPLDMADAYLTFARRGEHVGTTPILEVRKADGSVLDRWNPTVKQVMKQTTADSVNYALQEVVRRGTAKSAAKGINRPLAAKTGTTDEHSDAWLVGYTPSLATAVWMGYPEGSKHMDKVRGIRVTGGSFPAQIFADYMKTATKDTKAQSFVAPKNLGGLKSDNPKKENPKRGTSTTENNADDPDSNTLTTVRGPGRTTPTKPGLPTVPPDPRSPEPLLD